MLGEYLIDYTFLRYYIENDLPTEELIIVKLTPLEASFFVKKKEEDDDFDYSNAYMCKIYNTIRKQKQRTRPT